MYMEAKYEDEHSNIGASSRMTVNAWFYFWLHEIKEKTTRANTVRNYRERYRGWNFPVWISRRNC